MRHSYLFIIAIMLAVMTPRIAPAQSIAVKSNVLYDLTGTLNLGGEIRCDDTHSFNLSVNYNPNTISVEPLLSPRSRTTVIRVI